MVFDGAGEAWCPAEEVSGSLGTVARLGSSQGRMGEGAAPSSGPWARAGRGTVLTPSWLELGCAIGREAEGVPSGFLPLLVASPLSLPLGSLP